MPWQFSSRLTMLVISVLALCSVASAQVHQLDYDGFTVFLDCQRRGAVQFEYSVSKDIGSLPRKHSFSLDPDVPAECSQKVARTYTHPQKKYDRGHLVPANHLDHLPTGLTQSNFMTNVLPQARNMNRGAWLLTEEIIECRRDVEDLDVIGGVIYGQNPHDDYFLDKHGVATPDYFWKVVVAKNDAIGWIIPNSHEAKRRELDKYLISIRELEAVIQKELNVKDSLKDIRYETSWKKPKNCDLS